MCTSRAASFSCPDAAKDSPLMWTQPTFPRGTCGGCERIGCLQKQGIIRQCGEPMLDHACKHVPAKKRCVALCGAHGGRGGRACWWEVSWWKPEERRLRGAISPEDWCAPSPALLPEGAAEAARVRAPNSPDPDAACSRFSASELPCCFLRRWRATQPQHSFWPDMLQLAHRRRAGRLLLIFLLCHTNDNCRRKTV